MCRPGYGQPVGVKRKAEPGDTKCLARQKLCFPPQLFSALRSQHRPPLSIIASPTFIGRSITWSPTLLVAAVQQMAAHHAVAIARVLALVHPQIAGNGTHTLRSYRRWRRPPMKWEKPDGSAHLDPCLLGGAHFRATLYLLLFDACPLPISMSPFEGKGDVPQMSTDFRE
jgi:hypothetical protein